MSIIRRKRENNYTIVPNSILEDDRMSFEARGLLTYILTRPDHWEVQTAQLQEVTGFGRDKCQRLVREILECGYGKRETKHDEKGQFIGQELVFYDEIYSETPEPEFQLEGNRKPENREPEITAAGKSGPIEITESGLVRTDISRESGFSEFWDAYGKKVDRKQALDIWKRKKLHLLQGQIILAATSYSTGRDVQYRKSPFRWLRDENWNDESAVSATKADTTSLPEDQKLTAWRDHGVWLPEWGLNPDFLGEAATIKSPENSNA